jgi:hypothetical protein
MAHSAFINKKETPRRHHPRESNHTTDHLGAGEFRKVRSLSKQCRWHPKGGRYPSPHVRHLYVEGSKPLAGDLSSSTTPTSSA